MKRIILWFWLIVCCASCGTGSKDLDFPAKSDWSSKLGMAQSTDPYLSVLGDSLSFMPKFFPETKLQSINNSLQLNVAASEMDSAYYEIDLTEVNEIVSSVSIDVYPKDSAQASIVFNDLKNYYNSEYGKGGEATDYMVWYKEKDIEISVINESENYGKPYIVIIYFKEEGIAD
ncbi:MAG: hypothetical protein AB8B53_07750 [Flavobacteriales bacterium]